MAEMQPLRRCTIGCKSGLALKFPRSHTIFFLVPNCLTDPSNLLGSRWLSCECVFHLYRPHHQHPDCALPVPGPYPAPEKRKTAPPQDSLFSVLPSHSRTSLPGVAETRRTTWVSHQFW